MSDFRTLTGTKALIATAKFEDCMVTRRKEYSPVLTSDPETRNTNYETRKPKTEQKPKIRKLCNRNLMPETRNTKTEN